MQSRRTPLLWLLAIAIAGCGTVHPAGDYARTRALIQDHTGAGSVYDPAAEEAAGPIVEGLMSDGLTAEEAVQIALLNNNLFQSQFQEIGVSCAEVVQSGLFSNPALGFSARFPSGGGRSNLSFSLAQEIVDLWQIPVRKRIARDTLENTVSTVVALAIDLATRTRQTYFRIRVLEETEKVAAENLELLRRTETLAGNRFQAGETSILDVNLVRAEVLAATMRLESMRAESAVKRAELNRMLGLSRGQSDPALTDPLPARMPAIEGDDDLIGKALETRVDLKAAAAGLDAAEAEITKQRLAVIPSVSIGAEGERTDNRGPNALAPLPTDNAGLSARELVLRDLTDRRQRAFDRSQTIDLLAGPSVQVTLPLWDGNRAQIAKARYRFVQKQKEYADLVLGVIQDITQSSATLRAARELLRLSNEEALPLAEQNVDTARRVYEAGEDSIVALLLAQQNFNAQREAQFQYAGDYATSLFDLERAVGWRLDQTASEAQEATGTP